LQWLWPSKVSEIDPCRDVMTARDCRNPDRSAQSYPNAATASYHPIRRPSSMPSGIDSSDHETSFACWAVQNRGQNVRFGSGSDREAIHLAPVGAS